MASRFNFPFFQNFVASTGKVGAGWKMYFWQAGTTSTAQTTYSDAALQVANANPVVADANGRWPDIFLQDVLYNVELKDENDVLLDSADNVGNVNSATATTTATTLVESQTATSNGQAVFNLATVSYVPGINNISVYRNGAYITGYAETSSNIITLSAADATAVKSGDQFVFVVNQRSVNADTYQASSSVYNPAGAGAVASNVQAKLREKVSIKDFGAVVDGSTDDAAAVQAGIDHLASLGGGELYFPEGTCIVGTKITKPSLVILVGKGLDVSVIKQKNNSNLDAIIETDNFATQTNANKWFVSTEDVRYGFGCKSLTIDGNKANQSSGTGAGVRYYGKNYIFQDVRIINTYGDAFYSEAGTTAGQLDSTDMPEARIDRLYVYGAGGEGFRFRGPHDARIGSLFISTCTGDGAVFEETANYFGGADIEFIHSYGNTGSGIIIDTNCRAVYLQPEANTGKGIEINKTLYCNQLHAYQNSDLAVDINASLCKFGILSVTDNNSAGGVDIGANDCTISNLLIQGTSATSKALQVRSARNNIRGEIKGFSGVGGQGLYMQNICTHNNIDLTLNDCATGFEHNAGTAGNNHFNLIFDLSAGQTGITETVSFAGTDQFKVTGQANGSAMRSRDTVEASVDMSSTAVQTVTVNHNLFKSPGVVGFQLSHYATATQTTAGFVVSQMTVQGVTATQVTIQFKLSSTSATGNGTVLIRADVNA